jgi:cyanophycinase-like exopeptidase
MARISAESTLPIRAIAVDEKTAVLIDSNGGIQIVGQNDAYFLEQSEMAPEILSQGVPLTWDLNESAVKVFRANASVNLSNLKLMNWEFDWTNYWFVQKGELGVRDF